MVITDIPFRIFSLDMATVTNEKDFVNEGILKKNIIRMPLFFPF